MGVQPHLPHRKVRQRPPWKEGKTESGPSPDRVESVGETQLPFSVFLDYVLSLSDTKFKPGSWDLLRLNTNNFCDELSQFLCGAGVPKYILDLPPSLLETPLGEEVQGELDRICSSQQTSGSHGLIFQSLIGNSSIENLVLSRTARNQSPELEELEAQIEALRADQLSLEERRNALN